MAARARAGFAARGAVKEPVGRRFRLSTHRRRGPESQVYVVQPQNSQRAAVIIQLACIEELAAEARLRVSKRGFEQARIGHRDLCEEVECGRRWGFERQDFIISSQLSGPAVG